MQFKLIDSVNSKYCINEGWDDQFQYNGDLLNFTHPYVYQKFNFLQLLPKFDWCYLVDSDNLIRLNFGDIQERYNLKDYKFVYRNGYELQYPEFIAHIHSSLKNLNRFNEGYTGQGYSLITQVVRKVNSLVLNDHVFLQGDHILTTNLGSYANYQVYKAFIMYARNVALKLNIKPIYERELFLLFLAQEMLFRQLKLSDIHAFNGNQIIFRYDHIIRKELNLPSNSNEDNQSYCVTDFGGCGSYSSLWKYRTMHMHRQYKNNKKRYW